MANNIAHFAIHADEVGRARRFYEQVFGWRFKPWGPPDFYLVATGPDDEPGIHGSLQKRQTPVTGGGMTGYECTISVENLDEIGAAIENNGGKVVMQKTVIPSVGSLIQFLDTEGNGACAMVYDEQVE